MFTGKELVHIAWLNNAVLLTYTSPDYLLRIWIFDRYGRQITQLSQGHAAGTREALMWDGLNDNGQKVPIGRYIAYIEASDAAGRSIERYKTTVVVAR